jgi:hypothetical protein
MFRLLVSADGEAECRHRHNAHIWPEELWPPLEQPGGGYHIRCTFAVV